jgi:hypothetical protein
MARPVFGQPVPQDRPILSILDGRLAIVAQCRDPHATDARRQAGGVTPCYRCLAFSADSLCHFTREERQP